MPVTPLVDPVGAVGMDTVSAIDVKLAVTLFGPLITTEAGFVDPLRSPAQLEKPYPKLVLADTDTL